MTLKTIALAYVSAFVLAFYIGAGGADANPNKPGGGDWINNGTSLTGSQGLQIPTRTPGRVILPVERS